MIIHKRIHTPNLWDKCAPAVRAIELQSAAFVAANEVMAMKECEF
jgi:hypothetical protein